MQLILLGLTGCWLLEFNEMLTKKKNEINLIKKI